ncbi:hybrid signal transduction histidine kinase M, partial [Tanacetum coccineum]
CYKTTKAAWDAIETIFQDNKRTRTISLKGELRVIQIGDQTADEYFSKIEAILTLLTDLGSDISDNDVVTYVINGLSDKYESLAQIIAHKDPFPDLATVRSMVVTKELRLRSRSSVLPTGTTLSAPQVLLAEVSSRNQTGWNIVNGTTVPQHVRCVVILDVVFVVGAMLVVSFMTPLIPQQVLLSGTVQGSTLANGQTTLLPQAFNTMTFRDPTDANWNMDTGASSHLNSNSTNLSTLFNSCMYPSVPFHSPTRAIALYLLLTDLFT